jgi:hypothetical protein
VVSLFDEMLQINQESLSLYLGRVRLSIANSYRATRGSFCFGEMDESVISVGKQMVYSELLILY